MTRNLRLTAIAAVLAAAAGLSQMDFHGHALARAADSELAAPASAARAVPDFTALVKRAGPAVVNVTVRRGAESGSDMSEPPSGAPFPFPFPFDPQQPNRPAPMPQNAQGSGFIVSPDGYILTNAHVVAGADEGEIRIKLTDKREFGAKLIGADPRTDVAVLKIEGKDLPAVRIGSPDEVEVGEWVAAIGSPFGFENTISAGIISAKGRALPSETYVPYLQSDVALNPGSSGGPLFNLNGEVIGINSQIYSRTGGYMGLSFAVPIDIAMDVATQLRASGKVTRGRLGVHIQSLTQDLAKSFGLTRPDGALVSAVEKDSPAQKAGVEPGDVILEYNGKPVVDSTDLPVMVAKTKPGSEASVKVWRAGKEKTLPINVGELEVQKVAAAAPAAAPTGKLGMSVQELTAEQRKQLDVKGGVVVGAVQGAAAKAGIQPGDVVIAVNGELVESVTQFRGLLDKVGQGKPVALLIQRGEARIYVPVSVG
ncbi:MAG TPA: Do family serine endopeptidase [Burkholderiales bacterium]|jgi:serine protease Do